MDSPRSTTDWIFETVWAVALFAAIGEVALRWSSLPARIPVHFDASGGVNGWGGKSMLLVLVGSTIAMSILLTIAASFQRMINIPMNADRDSPAVRRLLRSMVIVMKTVMTLGFFWIDHVTIKTALGEPGGMGRLFLPLFLSGTFLPIVYFMVKLHRV